MMSGDCQSQGLAVWLQSLGWHESLLPSDLRKLNTPKMRSIWRHLQAQVVTTNVASTIRKNVLLAKLEEENIFVGQFRHFQLDSVNDLHKVKDIFEIEKEKDKIKVEIKNIDKKLENEKSLLLQSNTSIEWKRHKLKEIEDKTMILELKSKKLLKDCEKLNADIETAAILKSSKNCVSHSEMSYQKSSVCKYVKNYRYPFQDIDDDSEYLCEMMGSILKFKPDAILNGVIRIVKEALSSLNAKVNITANIGDKASENMVTFQEELKKLKILIIRKELNIRECLDKIELESNELQRAKAEYVKKLIVNNENNSSPGKNSDDSRSDESEKGTLENHSKETFEETGNGHSEKYVSQFFNDVLTKIRVERKSKKVWEQNNRLMPDDEFEPSENVIKRSVKSLKVQEEELWKEVEKKVSKVNMVTSVILHSSLVYSGKLNELLAEISQLASDFKTETSQELKKNIDGSELTDMIIKEIKVFKGTPMVALHRKWDTSNEMLRVCLSKKFSNPTLLQFLLQSEEKNIIVNVLEKYFWSLYISPQFH